MLALGLDTSCYTTSAALCAPGQEPRQERRLLPVAAGERGLRQSEAVFAHIGFLLSTHSIIFLSLHFLSRR